jgi:hypothetical protein
MKCKVGRQDATRSIVVDFFFHGDVPSKLDVAALPASAEEQQSTQIANTSVVTEEQEISSDPSSNQEPQSSSLIGAESPAVPSDGCAGEQKDNAESEACQGPADPQEASVHAQSEEAKEIPDSAALDSETPATTLPHKGTHSLIFYHEESENTTLALPLDAVASQLIELREYFSSFEGRIDKGIQERFASFESRLDRLEEMIGRIVTSLGPVSAVTEVAV